MKAENTGLRADRDRLLAEADVALDHITEALDFVAELEAEVARLRDENRELRKLAAKDSHASIIREMQLERRVAELEAENAGPRDTISKPARSFGTPALIAWAERLQEIISEYPEDERGNAAFVFTMGDHLEKFAKAWNSPTLQHLYDQNVHLRARIDELGAALTDLIDLVIGMETLYTSGWQNITAYTEGIEEAFAALHADGSQAAPKEGYCDTCRSRNYDASNPANCRESESGNCQREAEVEANEEENGHPHYSLGQSRPCPLWISEDDVAGQR